MILNKDGNVVGGKPHIVRGKDLETLPTKVQNLLETDRRIEQRKIHSYQQWPEKITQQARQEITADL